MPSPRPPSSVTRLAFFLSALAVSACRHTTSPPDAGRDARIDVSADTAAAETQADTGSDAVADALPDSAAEAGADAAAEVNPACAAIARDATRNVYLRITADNECEVFVNGASVGKTTSWPSPVALDVSLFVHPGRRNVLAVLATNTSSQGGLDRGVIGQLDLVADGGSTIVLITDASWRSSKVLVAGWTDLTFDDSGWVAATELGAHGIAPWGGLLGNSTGKWIWSGPVPSSTADKPDLETAYLRRGFYFSTDGNTISDQPSCP